MTATAPTDAQVRRYAAKIATDSIVDTLPTADVTYVNLLSRLVVAYVVDHDPIPTDLTELAQVAVDDAVVDVIAALNRPTR